MELVILGSGTSHGIPVIGCSCPICTSTNPKDTRLRSSALIIGDEGEYILIDSGPEFRIQALKEGLTHIDAVLITHSHADHLHGIDDVRIFTRDRVIPVYANKPCVKDIKSRFSYIFKKTQEGGGKPHLSLHSILPPYTPFYIGTVRIEPIPLYHGNLPILGWKFGDTAYLTDCNHIPQTSYAILQGVKNLVIDSLRARKHSTHFNFEQALQEINEIGAEQAWFTHICHDFSHDQIVEWIQRTGTDKKIEPAYDGLRIKVSI